ncbi:MAG: putative phosphate transport system regulatory protein [Actinomycetota bacterium]|jgi:phosphate transport system protein
MTEATPERLTRVQTNLVDMTKLVRVAMVCATEALLSADVHLAEQVISDDSEINAINASIEQSCLEILSTPNLTPKDIRMTVASLRMSTTLERMGDLAAHVAKQARLRFPFVSVPDELHETFAQMGNIANAIVERTARVIETNDLRYAADIQAEDEVMDAIHRELFSKVLDPTWSHGVEGAIDVTLLSRFYERFADHGVTIARRVAFVVTGENYGVSDLAAAAESE